MQFKLLFTYEDWILLQVVTKFGNLKVDSGGDVVVSFDAKYIILQNAINWSNDHHHMLSSENITVSALSLILSKPNLYHLLQAPILLV